MRKVWTLACTLAIVSAAVGFAQTPSVAPLSSQALAAILGQPAVNGSCPTAESGVVFAARRPGLGWQKDCSASATCGSDPPVSCSYSGSGGSCSFANRNCPNQQGYVTCQGVTTWCPTECPPSVWCQQCDATGDCFACCRCDGGGAGHCAYICG
jgi:hypothetical protein